MNERANELLGSCIVALQLAQLIIVLIRRAYVEAEPTVAAGWLRALRDNTLAPEIKLMHGEPVRS